MTTLLQTSALAAVSFLLAGVAAAAPSTAEATYRLDRAACMDGSSQQERSSCLREAGAALAEARRGRLGTESTAVYAANAVLRCKAHTDMAARTACERMAAGEGSTTGSAASGGILRSLTTVVVEGEVVAPKPAP